MMTPKPKTRKQAIVEEHLQHMNLNYERDDDGDFTEEDALEELAQECGKMSDGSCTLAGTEYCDWDCPFSEE